MLKTSELRRILGVHFNWHKSRLDCFLQILIGLFIVRTVNLREIALAIESNAKIESCYRRLKAFFTKFKINRIQIARWIFHLFVSKDGKKLYLSIDRTNWYFGKKKINVFALSIAHEGVAIPIHWMLLNKAGNSTAQEQIQLIEWFTKKFGIECIEGLLADREFANKKLFSWLIKQKIPFYIRIKDNTHIRLFKQSKHSNLRKLFRGVHNKKRNYYPYSIFIWGLRLNVAAGRSESGELLVVVTNADAKNAVPIYLRRWEIECLFQCLKGRGFRFEETHITDQKKLSTLICILAVGVAWSIKVGEWRARREPIRLNQHYDSLRPQYSYFRYGLDYIRETLINNKDQVKKLRKSLVPIEFEPIKIGINLAW